MRRRAVGPRAGPAWAGQAAARSHGQLQPKLQSMIALALPPALLLPLLKVKETILDMAATLLALGLAQPKPKQR